MNEEEKLEIQSVEISEGSSTIVNDDKNAEGKHRAERFIDLVKAGKDPKDAVRAAGATLPTIKDRADFLERVGRILADTEMDAALQQRLVDAGLNKMFVESVDSKSLDERKHALAVAKQIGQNKNFSPSDGVTIDLGGLTEIIKGATLPNIPDYKESDNARKD